MKPKKAQKALGCPLDGKKIAEKIKEAAARSINALSAAGKIKLAVLKIADSPSSEAYLNALKRTAAELSIKCDVVALPASASQEEAESEISRLNADDSVTGIIVQAPVPKSIEARRLFSRIAQNKDAEGVNPANIGAIAYEKWEVAPSAASACLALLDSAGVELEGKEAVIVGHSAIVGKPLSMMLLSRLATTTVCHIGTYNRGLLEEHVRRADILVVAVGKSRLIKGGWIKKGSIVIDVGINKNGDGVTGDVDYDEAVKRAAYITPVPGGVGPVTAAILIKNLVTLYRRREGQKHHVL